MAPGQTSPKIDAAGVIADLRELDELTGGPGGARRICWGPEWLKARGWLGSKLSALGLSGEQDEAGNRWAYLPGKSPDLPALAVGSHLDSVPAGGWLDGALGVIAGLGVIRAWVESGEQPERTIALVDFADEEGARFGRSLFGSSAVSGTLDPDAVAGLTDSGGERLDEVVGRCGVDLGRVLDAGRRLDRLGAYLELHIEQGPVLESRGLSCSAVRGCSGVERELFRFRGQAAHAGTTPLKLRSDAGLAAAFTALAVERLANTVGAVGTCGSIDLEPGIVTAVPGRAALSCDLRHADAEVLGALHESVRAAAGAAAEGRGCEFEVEPIWRIEPIAFDTELVELASEAVAAAGGTETPMTSGALHDCAEIARRVPAAMIFAQSLGGLSHAKEEDSAEEDLVAAIEAFGAVAGRVAASAEPIGVSPDPSA